MSDGHKNQGKSGFGARPVSDYVSRLLDPVIERRAGMSMDLKTSWVDIVGEDYAAYCRPEKCNWPKKADVDDSFQPATLVLACEEGHAIYLQHDTGLIIERVNGFFGFHAVDRIKFVQKPLNQPSKREKQRMTEPLEAEGLSALKKSISGVEDDKIRDALERLGKNIFSKRSDADM